MLSHLKIVEDKLLHLPCATAAKEGDDDDDGRDADEDVGGGASMTYFAYGLMVTRVSQIHPIL